VPLCHAEDSHQSYEWEGTLIAAVTTQRPAHGDRRPRWLEMNLYRLDSGGYLLHRLGRSVVYHAAAGPCAFKGEEVLVETLPDDAVRCEDAPLARGPVCAPRWPQDLADDEVVLLEQVRHTIDQGPDPQSIVERASVANHRKEGVRSVGLSQPVKEMIRKAAACDEGFAAFAAAPKRAERIG
jgi:hypothetical protein